MKILDRKRLALPLAVGLAVSAMSTVAMADEGLSYNYIDAVYVDSEIDDGLDIDGDGIAVAGSVAIGESTFLHAGYGTLEFDGGVDLDQWTVGFGAHAPIADNVDIVGRLGYVDAKLDTPFGDADDDGYSVGIGLRGKLSESFELEGGVSYVDLDDSGDDTSFNLGARYYLTENFALGAGVNLGDDVTTWNAGVRFQF
ncbi:MAG: outer membrane beta-barrel protein [Pseudomonadales bacterium]|nr:outer membrane beta-barrel protein [Pseudomonadales bacterium]